MVTWRGFELPGFSRALAGVSAERREALAAHLRDYMPPAPAPPSATRRTPAPTRHFPDACRACGGHCCGKGGDTAYLDEPSLRIAWCDQPQLTRDELIAAYAGCVPDLAFAGSCIFHAAQGCNLPGNLRSVVCKTYLCNPLRQAQPG